MSSSDTSREFEILQNLCIAAYAQRVRRKRSWEELLELIPREQLLALRSRAFEEMLKEENSTPDLFKLKRTRSEP